MVFWNYTCVFGWMVWPVCCMLVIKCILENFGIVSAYIDVILLSQMTHCICWHEFGVGLGYPWMWLVWMCVVMNSVGSVYGINLIPTYEKRLWCAPIIILFYSNCEVKYLMFFLCYILDFYLFINLELMV